MNLHQVTLQYLVYLKTLRLSPDRYQTYRYALTDILEFYGKDCPLESLDNQKVLDYVRVNDPFDCDPVRVERGTVFCKFTHWLMFNHLIPAWADEMARTEDFRQRLPSHTQKKHPSDTQS